MNPVPFILSLSCAALLAVPPSTPPVRPAQVLENATSFTGPVAIQTFAEGTFCYTTFQATQLDLPAKMKEKVPQLVKALVASNLGTLGPLHVIYQGTSPDPAKPFEVQVGVLAPLGTKAFPGYQVRQLPAFTCATTVFTGPLAQIGKVYETLYPALQASGKIPLSESRQMILFYEDETSPNNMFLIQIGLR